MNGFKIIFIALFIGLGTTVSMACTCFPLGFCEVFKDTSTVVEARVIKVYEVADSDHHFVDVEVVGFLYGAPTLPFDYDTLTIVDRNYSCDSYLYQFAKPGDSFVFMFDELVSEEEVPYGTFDLSMCYTQYLSIQGTSLFGRFTRAGNSSMDYNTFKQNPKGSCELLQTNPVSEQETVELNIFPNPVQENLNVKTNRDQNFEYFIYSNTGEVVRSGKEIQQSDFDIDLSSCSSGVYYLQVRVEGQIFHKKLVKI